MRIVSLLLPLLLLTAVAGAQEETVPDTLLTDSLIMNSGYELEYVAPVYAHLPPDTLDTGPSPTLALFKSMLIPGWGQLSNRRYIKAGIFIAAEAALVATIVHYSEKTNTARDRFDLAPDDDVAGKQLLFNAYEDAKDDRNRFGWFLGTTIFISMFDAFVDAHLTDFPKKGGDLSMKVVPEKDDGLALKITMRF